MVIWGNGSVTYMGNKRVEKLAQVAMGILSNECICDKRMLIVFCLFYHSLKVIYAATSLLFETGKHNILTCTPDYVCQESRL